MSSNNFFNIKDEINLFLYKNNVSRFKDQRNQQSTLESTLLIENIYIAYVKDVIKNSFENFKTLDEFEMLDMNSHGYNIKYINRKFLNTVAITNFLESKYINVINHINTLLYQLEGKIKRINQKKAALSLWKNDVSFLHLEKFLNYDNIKDSYSKGKTLTINQKQGIALLPVQGVQDVKIKNVIIKNGNGNPGNSDKEVDIESQYLKNVMDNNTDTYFEYEKLNRGPLKLSLEIDLFKKEIVNSISIWPFINSENLGYEIEDILFYKDKVGSISIFTLIEMNEIYIGSMSKNESFDIDFLPIECSSIVINFRQEYAGNIKTERRLRERINKRYSIGIREIGIKRKSFANSGEISSSDINLNTQSFIMKSDLNIYPKTEDLYKCNMDVLFGTKWKKLDIEKNTSFKEILLDGDETKFSWKLFLEKKSDEFKNKSSYEENLSLLKTKVKNYNKKINPCVVSYEGKVKEENIGVMCESGIARTYDKKKYKILKTIKTESLRINFMIDGVGHTPDGSILKINFPISLKKNKIDDEDIGIIVNGVEYSSVRKPQSLSEYEYFISYKDNSVWFASDVFPGRGRVQWFIKPEILHFEEDSKYFYSKFDFNLNPNKKTIDIHYLDPIETTKEKSIKGNARKMFLEEGIDDSSISIISNSDLLFESCSDFEELDNFNTNGSIGYFFESESGILFFSQRINVKGIHKVKYKIKERKKIMESEYEIWEKNSIPIGIKIKKENFSSEKVSQMLFSDIEGTFSVRENKVVSKDNLFDNGTYDASGNRISFNLKYPSIIKNSLEIKSKYNTKSIGKYQEVEFIDGESEFLNLTFVEDERTNAINANNQIVSFALGARNLYYKKLGIEFEDKNVFKALKESEGNVSNTGDYHVSETGIVTLKINTSSLKEGIKYSYYYLGDDTSLKDKFSIDYKDSIIYFSEALDDSNAVINYRIANYSAEYDILSKVDDYEVDFTNNEVKINSEEFVLNRGKVFIFYKSNISEYNLENIVEYFSPIVYDLKMVFK